MLVIVEKSFVLGYRDRTLPVYSVLLLDSWSKILDNILAAENCQLKIIPEEPTKYAQPLDGYFFNPYKIFVKRLEIT